MDNDTDGQFAQDLARFGKSYLTKEEYENRRSIFEGKLSSLRLQDDSITWKRGLNKFSDMTEEEFKGGYLGARNVENLPSAEFKPLSLG